MNTDKKTFAEIVKMRLPDIMPALAILEETGLESWKYVDIETEVKNDNPLVLAGKINSKVIGFCIARLIMSQTTPTNNSFVKSSYSPIADIGELKNTENTNKFMPECEIYNIAVKREFQSRGIGSGLLNQIILHISQYNAESIWLEVRSSNRQAIGFYQKNNFEKVYERKDFYSKPLENAIVMKRNLQPKIFT